LAWSVVVVVVVVANICVMMRSLSGAQHYGFARAQTGETTQKKKGKT